MEIDEKCEEQHLEHDQADSNSILQTGKSDLHQGFLDSEKIVISNNDKDFETGGNSRYGLISTCDSKQSNQHSGKDLHNINKMPKPKRGGQGGSNNTGETTILKSEQLKDLLVLQLDLIEHQQIKIFQKDKQIISLQNEKEQLEARLSRMERRISVQKKHSLELTASHDDILTTKQKSLLIPLKSPATIQPPVNKKIGFSVDNSADKNLIPVTVTSCNDKDFWFENFLRTNINYLDPPICTDSVFTENDNEEAKPKEKIPVPPWKSIREKIQQSSSKDLNEDELHEDISNSAYEKRHSKPEQEEKRRKRWDLQQARQQRQHEMLVQKYNEREQKGKVQSSQVLPKDGIPAGSSSQISSMESIYRESDHIMAVEISDLVPVCAFGYPLPSLPPRELDLPWFSVAKREVQIRAARNKHIAKTKKKSKGLHLVGKRKR